MTPAGRTAGAHPRAVVTGASSGLGLELARGLARRGFDLVITARSGEALRRLARELTDTHGVKVQVVVADLAEPDGPDTVADAVLAAERAPTVVVNNAGAGQYGPWLEANGDEERRLLRLNMEAPTRLARRLVPTMVSAGGGHLLNVSSLAAFVPGPRLAVYYASRAYVLSWSEALAEEFRGSGVTVTCLCPGPMDTGFQARAGFRFTAAARKAAQDPARVAEAGLRGALSGKALVLPGATARLTVLGIRFLPRRWLARLVHAVQRSRDPEGGPATDG